MRAADAERGRVRCPFDRHRWAVVRHGSVAGSPRDEVLADLVDDLGKFVRLHLARQAFVLARVRIHRRDAVLLVARVPGLNRAPREAIGRAVLVLVIASTDVMDAGDDRVSRRELDGPKDAHFEIGEQATNGDRARLTSPSGEQQRGIAKNLLADDVNRP